MYGYGTTSIYSGINTSPFPNTNGLIQPIAIRVPAESPSISVPYPPSGYSVTPHSLFAQLVEKSFFFLDLLGKEIMLTKTDRIQE
jgi:hypothetical protein